MARFEPPEWLKPWIELGQDVGAEWSLDRGSRMAAALAYSTVFSLAPLLIIAIFVSGQVYGRDAVQGLVFERLEEFLGAEVAKFIENLIAQVWLQETATFAIVGAVLLFFSASGLFLRMRRALADIFDAAPDATRGLIASAFGRLTGFVGAIAIGLVFVVILSANTALHAVADQFDAPALVQIGTFIGSVILSAGMVMFLYRYLTPARPPWSSVRVGGSAAGVALVLGMFVGSFLLSKSTITNTYGAAASVVIVLLLAYYLGQIFFMGAQLTKVWSRRSGR